MDEKVYDLLEKMYIEFSQRFDKVDGEISGLKKDVQKNNNDIIRLENEFSNKFGILFDAQKTTNERLDRIESKLDDISQKVDKHDIKIQVIEGGKAKKSVK